MHPFAYSTLIGMPSEYFSSLCFRDVQSDLFHLGVLHAMGTPPPPEHPPPTPLTVFLGELAEKVNITIDILHCFDSAARITDDALQQSFLNGVCTALGVPVADPQVPLPVCDSNVDVPVHCVGTVDGVRQYWRREKKGITWLYSSSDAEDVGVDGTTPGCLYISNHTQALVEPEDTTHADVHPSGYINIETKSLLLFPATNDDAARWAARVDAVIDALLARGDRLNRRIKLHLHHITVVTKRVPVRGKCGLCALQRTLSYSVECPEFGAIAIGCKCAAQLTLCVRLASIPTGTDPSDVLAKLATHL